MKQSFTSFLGEKHCEENPMLLDDMLPDAFNEWLGELDPETMIMYANMWVREMLQDINKIL